MADFNFDELRGAFSRAEVVKLEEDSNYGRLLKATGERLMELGFYRQGHVCQDPEVDQGHVEYPWFGVYPASLPEQERTNVSNQKTYSALVTMSTKDDNPWRGTMRILFLRERAEDACRSKRKIQLRDGDFHENTTLDTTPYVLAEGEEGGGFVFSTGFRVNYMVTEPRREE